jgi:hypothetical protein
MGSYMVDFEGMGKVGALPCLEVGLGRYWGSELVLPTGAKVGFASSGTLGGSTGGIALLATIHHFRWRVAMPE